MAVTIADICSVDVRFWQWQRRERETLWKEELPEVEDLEPKVGQQVDNAAQIEDMIYNSACSSLGKHCHLSPERSPDSAALHLALHSMLYVCFVAFRHQSRSSPLYRFKMRSHQTGPSVSPNEPGLPMDLEPTTRW